MEIPIGSRVERILELVKEGRPEGQAEGGRQIVGLGLSFELQV